VVEICCTGEEVRADSQTKKGEGIGFMVSKHSFQAVKGLEPKEYILP
jgi:hypothetical protein